MEILEGKILLWLESARFVKNKSGVYAASYGHESDHDEKLR